MTDDLRHHMQSLLMRESLIDKDLVESGLRSHDITVLAGDPLQYFHRSWAAHAPVIRPFHRQRLEHRFSSLSV